MSTPIYMIKSVLISSGLEKLLGHGRRSWNILAISYDLSADCWCYA